MEACGFIGLASWVFNQLYINLLKVFTVFRSFFHISAQSEPHEEKRKVTDALISELYLEIKKKNLFFIYNLFFNFKHVRIMLLFHGSQ